MQKPFEYYEICPLYIGPNNVNIQRNRNIFLTAFTDYRDVKYKNIKEGRDDFGISQKPTVHYNPLLMSTAGLKKLYSDVKDSNRQETTSHDGTPKKRKLFDDLTLRSTNFFSNSTHSFQIEFDTNQLLAKRYRIIGVIGEGAFSILVKAVDTYSPLEPQKLVAIKIMNPKYNRIGIQESRTLRLLNSSDPDGHSHIIQLYCTFYHENHFCMVLELLHSTMLTTIKKLAPRVMPISELRKIALQLITTLLFLEKHSIIHADLKPENVLLKGAKFSEDVATRSIKIIDFGNAIKTSESATYHDHFEVQSLFYRAPEILFGIPFGTAIDMWSVGCILMELYTGEPLFYCENNLQLYQKMVESLGPVPSHPFQQGKYYLKYFSRNHTPLHVTIEKKVPAIMSRLVSARDANFVDFIFGLLEYDPAKRLTPSHALTHSFLAPLFPFALLSPYGRPHLESLYSRVASSNAFRFIFEASPIPKQENGIKIHEEEEKIEIDDSSPQLPPQHGSLQSLLEPTETKSSLRVPANPLKNSFPPTVRVKEEGPPEKKKKGKHEDIILL